MCCIFRKLFCCITAKEHDHDLIFMQNQVGHNAPNLSERTHIAERKLCTTIPKLCAHDTSSESVSSHSVNRSFDLEMQTNNIYFYSYRLY